MAREDTTHLHGSKASTTRYKKGLTLSSDARAGRCAPLSPLGCIVHQPKATDLNLTRGYQLALSGEMVSQSTWNTSFGSGWAFRNPNKTFYIPEAYESLPSLREAANLFKETQAREPLLDPIGQLFLDSGMHGRYGVSLLHKHFSMETNQRLVDLQNLSTPWTVPKYEGFVIPRTFRFFNGIWSPVEFDYSPCTSDGDPDPAFLVGISALLRQHGLENVLGVRSLDRYDSELSVEITEGKTNIMMPRGSVKDSELIEAVWVFSTDDDERCHCRKWY
ncbi:hypothetical protein FQN51_003026 [Onygenales sp. PD_10]|nr:hypothetical protein FQN51_003026 [Onygenales sp. PD_10]